MGSNTIGTGAATSVTVTVTPLLTPTCTLTASPASISAGGTSLLTASCSPVATSYGGTCTAGISPLTGSCNPAATSYIWSGGTCAGTTATNCTVTPSATTTYTVSANTTYNIAGFDHTVIGSAAAVTVTVTPLPTPTCTLTASPASISAGDTSLLTASCSPTATSYSWSANTGFASTVSTGTVSPSDTTTYIVMGRNDDGTGNTSATTVIVTAITPSNPPICTLTATPASITLGGSSTLTASCNPAATSYIWSGGICTGTSAVASCSVTPSATTIYTVAGRNASGSSVVAAVTVTVVSTVAGQVVEFYNTNLDNYFITADSGEAAQIDGGSAGPGWIRTGNTFQSGGGSSVCRFYGSYSPGPNSHFYTVDPAECQGLKDQQFPTGDARKLTEKSWNFESLDFVSTPAINQICPSGTVPVYRAYNNGFARGVDSNHRISTNLTAINQQVTNCGWSNEGVVMCAPSGIASGGTTTCGNPTPAAVNGSCGSSNGSTVATAPTTNICNAGTASGVSGAGPWTWTCQGSNGGVNASCSASKVSTTVKTAEGFWSGIASTGYQVSLVVLETGETWGVYTANNLIYGALYGMTSSSGTTLTGSGSDFFIPYRTVAPAYYSGSFSSKSSISIASSGTTFTGTYDTSYDQPASLASLSGTFNGWGVTGNTSAQTATVGITSSGVVTSYGIGCNATGTAVPRASGKNIFNVTITFTGSYCALGNGAVTTGIAYYDAPTRQLLVMAMNGAKTDGFIYVGAKP